MARVYVHFKSLSCRSVSNTSGGIFLSRPGAVKSRASRLTSADFLFVRPTGVKVHSAKAVASAEPYHDPSVKPDACNEKLVDLSQFLTEAKSIASDFVFTDTDFDEPAWEHELRFAQRSPQVPSVTQEAVVKNALDPTLVDITSAYSVEQGFQEIDVQQLAGSMASNSIAILLDVRSEEEHNSEGHVAGARHVSMSELSEVVRAGLLDDFREGPLAVICASGSRSAQATVRLTRVSSPPWCDVVCNCYEAADKLQRECVLLRQEVLGPKHPDTLRIMGNLAKCLRAQGKYTAAAEYMEQILAGFTEVLGAKHPDTLSV